MVELARSEAAIIACHADPGALDAIAAHPAAISGRVAPDELLFIGPPELRDDLLARGVSAVGPTGGIAVDQSDAWTVFCVLGDGAEEAFRRLSHVLLPTVRPGFVQCPVAHVPCKVIAADALLYVLAPAPAAHHVEQRLVGVSGTTVRPRQHVVAFADRTDER